MAILTDFHTHSQFSGDCSTPMEDMILQAVSMGMSQLCFTEHFDPDYPKTKEMLDFSLDTEKYRSLFLELGKKYGKKIQLLWGVELGIQSHLYDFLSDYVRSHSFDFVIGSSHLLLGQDPYYPEFFKDKKEEDVYETYFSSILENVQNFEDYDVYGHLDYIVRYGPNKDKFYSYDRYGDILDEILKNIIRKGKGIELNTGGIKYGLKELHPASAVLKRYKELGGEIVTIGSDAHSCLQLGNHFSRAENMLLSCGFRYYTVFKSRKPEFLPL